MTVGELSSLLRAFEDDMPVYVVQGMHTRTVEKAALSPDWMHEINPGLELHAGMRVG